MSEPLWLRTMTGRAQTLSGMLDLEEDVLSTPLAAKIEELGADLATYEADMKAEPRPECARQLISRPRRHIWLRLLTYWVGSLRLLSASCRRGLDDP